MVVLEKTESPLNCKEINPELFIEKTDAEVEAPILWSPDVKSWLIRKDPESGKDWRQKEKGTTVGKMLVWHHQHNKHEFDQAPGDDEEQGSLACCISWGLKELDTTQWLNNKQQNFLLANMSSVQSILIHINNQENTNWIERQSYYVNRKYFICWDWWWWFRQ